jgi:acyl-CoA reductase-like NAD-dependent aldehyde dehydrogenase
MVLTLLAFLALRVQKQNSTSTDVLLAFGAGVALFTASGGAARKFEHEIEVGQIGINVPVPGAPHFTGFTRTKAKVHKSTSTQQYKY